MLLSRHAITESHLHSCLSFPDFTRARQYSCWGCCLNLPPVNISTCKYSLYIVSWTRAWWRVVQRFQGRSEHSTQPFGHRSLALLSVYFPVLLSHCLSSYTSLTCHLPVKTFTIELLSSSPSLLLRALSTSSSLQLPWLDTGHAQPKTALPVCLIKM